MTMKRFIPADKALVHQRPAGPLIEIPENDAGVVVEWHCDVAMACDGGPRPRIEHNVDMTVDGPGYPATRVSFAACAGCCRLIAPNSVRLMLAAFGVDLPPGLMPD